MKLTSSRTASVVLTVVLLGVAAACGDDDDASSDTTTAAAAETTAAPTDTAAATTVAGADTTEAAATETTGADTTAASAPEAGATTVAASEGELGTILVDGAGTTLYMFMPDAQGPSTCVDACLAAWPAVAGPATAGEGVDESLLGTATRSDDGTEQVTYNGWPLYYFAQDAAPGDTNGQGVSDVWYAVDATTGEPIS